MIELYINDRKVDLNDNIDLSLNYIGQTSEAPTTTFNTFSKTIQLPGTPNNNDIFGNIFNLNNKFIPSRFDPHKRTPFKLYVNKSLYEEGYIELTKVTNNHPYITYDITLYGSLGDFLYSLKFDSEGNERSFSDLYWKWIPYVTGTETEAYADAKEEALAPLMKMSSYNMTNAWHDICMMYEVMASVDRTVFPEQKYIINDVVMMPTLCGTPSDDFDASKIMIDPVRCSSTLAGDTLQRFNTLFPQTATIDSESVKYYEDQSGHWIIAEATRDLNPFEARCIPTKECELGLRTMAFLGAISDPVNNGGYTIRWGLGTTMTNKAVMSMMSLGKINPEKLFPQYKVPELPYDEDLRIYSNLKGDSQISSEKYINFETDIFGGNSSIYLDLTRYSTPKLKLQLTNNEEFIHMLGGYFGYEDGNRILSPIWETQVNTTWDKYFYNFGDYRKNTNYSLETMASGTSMYVMNLFQDSDNAENATKVTWNLSAQEIKVYNNGVLQSVDVYLSYLAPRYLPYDLGEGYKVSSMDSDLVTVEVTTKASVMAKINSYYVNKYSGITPTIHNINAIYTDDFSRIGERYTKYSPQQIDVGYYNNQLNDIVKTNIGNWYNKGFTVNQIRNNFTYTTDCDLSLSNTYDKCSIKVKCSNIAIDWDSTLGLQDVREVTKNAAVINQPCSPTTIWQDDILNYHAFGTTLIYDNPLQNDPWNNFVFGMVINKQYDTSSPENTRTKLSITDIMGKYVYLDVYDNFAGGTSTRDFLATRDPYIPSSTQTNGYLAPAYNAFFGSHHVSLNYDSCRDIGALYKYRAEPSGSKVHPQAQFYNNSREQYFVISGGSSYIYDNDDNIDNYNTNIPLLTKDAIFSNMKTPFDHFMDLCRVFNWRLDYDIENKEVLVYDMKHNYWYEYTEEAEFDHTSFDIDPISIHKKYIKWGFETPDSYPVIIKNNNNFDKHILNTTFDINSDTEELFDGTSMKTFDTYMLTSPYFRSDLMIYPPVICNTDFTLTMYNFTDANGNTDLTPDTLKSINKHDEKKWTYTDRINELNNFEYDLIGHFDSSDGYINSAGSLLFFNGFIKNYNYVEYGSGHNKIYQPLLGFYDVTNTMLKLNENKACYMYDIDYTAIDGLGLLDNTSNWQSPAYIPLFTRTLDVYQVVHADKTMNWGKLMNPESLYIDNVDSKTKTLVKIPEIANFSLYSNDLDPDEDNYIPIPSSTPLGIYDSIWAQEASNIYHIDTIKVTARLRIKDPKKAMHTKYNYKGNTFVIEKIFNFNPEIGDQYCKVQLRRWNGS